MSNLSRKAQEIAHSRGVEELLRLAWEEDVGSGDITTASLLPPSNRVRAVVVAREAGVFCGAPFAKRLVELADCDLQFESPPEGVYVNAGDQVLLVEGLVVDVLASERVILNLLQRLCGIATATRRFVEAAGEACQILETRKTVPGWRALDKYAVLAGGGSNHRMGLHDQILAKENHFAIAAENGDSSFSGRVQRVVENAPQGMTVGIEVENLQQLDEALQEGVDLVLLDNMDLDDLSEAVHRRDKSTERLQGHRILLEASGGIVLETVGGVAATGVDRISVGALTHSVEALDLSMTIVEP